MPPSPILAVTVEPCQPIRISGKRLGQDLQCHLPVQLGIGGLIDLAHAPLADEGGDLVVAESGADGERHGGGLVDGTEILVEPIKRFLNDLVPPLTHHAMAARIGTVFLLALLRTEETVQGLLTGFQIKK